MRAKDIISRFVLSFVFLVFAGVSLATPPDLTKPLRGRLRAGYMAASNINLLEKMSQIGMNAVMPKFDAAPRRSGEDVIRYITTLQRWADKCDRLNLVFMPVINWWDASQAKYFLDYNHVVTDNGKVLENTPCPYTASFWKAWLTPRSLQIIQAVGSRPLAAVLIDLEMYGVESPTYGDCYCHECFSRYMKAKGLGGSLPSLGVRAAIVKSTGDLTYYQSLQRETARSYATSLRAAVQKVRPGLRLGVLTLDTAIPLKQGMALGFGTPQVPVFCLSEASYTAGYASNIVSVQKRFKDLDASVDLVMGIFQSRFPPANTPEQLYYCAHDTYGYWIFTMQSFKQPDYLPLTGTVDDNWFAIKQANDELDKLAYSQSYTSSLAIHPFIPPPDWAGLVKYPLHPESRRCLKNIPIVRLRGSNWIYFYAKQNEKIAFQVTYQQMGRYTDVVHVGLVSPILGQLRYGVATKSQPFYIQVSAPVTGVYGMVVQTGDNAADLTEASHPYAVEALHYTGAGFVTKVPPLFIAFEPSNASTARLQFRTECSGEAVFGKVLAKNGTLLWSGIVDGSTIVTINRHPGDTYVQVQFNRMPNTVLEDVWIKTLQGFMPFASTDPAGLLYTEQVSSY